MRLYIQQLEERVRQLTGENERLLYELNQLRAQLGQPPLPADPEQTGAVAAAAAGADGVQVGAGRSGSARRRRISARSRSRRTIR